MISIKNLNVEFSDKTVALKDINITIENEKCIGIIGANGAGKSTLLSSVMGLVPVKSGEIEIDGVISGKKTISLIRKKVGMVFQNPDDQLFMPTVYEDLMFGPKNYGMDTEKAEAYAEKILEKMGISHLKERYTHKLSWGEKRKVAIACVLMLEPSIMLLDEPTSFLDPKSRTNLMKLLTELDCTKIITTHDLDMALDICDRIIIIRAGEKAADGEPVMLLKNKTLLEECNLELPLKFR